jgi:hypothetical protein
MKSHVIDGTRCWCKERVPVMFAGERIGDAHLDSLGMITMSISSPILASKIELGTTEHITIATKKKG